MTAAAAEASRRDRRRNETCIRIGRIKNGYLITEQMLGEGYCATTREELHQKVDEFFDAVEARQRDEASQPPDIDHRKTSRPRGGIPGSMYPLRDARGKAEAY